MRKCRRNKKGEVIRIEGLQIKNKVEIDYEKLAEAIVKANATSDSLSEKKLQNEDKLTLWDAFIHILNIIFNKKETNGTMTLELLGTMINIVFNSVAILGVIVLLCTSIVFVDTMKGFVWSVEMVVGNILGILCMIAIVFIIAVFSLIFRGAANEIKREKDRSYVVDVFSGVVSFAALIVAIVALLKGVTA